MEADNKMDLSFSGAGFMGCYYFGVVDCWNKYIPRDRVNRVAGASAGSLIAAYYLCDLPLGDCLKEIVGLTQEIRSRPLGVFDRSHQIVDILPKILDRLFPDDAHKRVSGRLHVCMTRLKDLKKIIVNEFETKKDLIDALNCSCFIPVWSGNHVSTYKGIKHIDGGFTDNLPVFDEYTIKICCFSGASDISPYDRAKLELLSGRVNGMPLYLNFANFRRIAKALFPPPADYIIGLLERGFHDTKDFILSNDLIQCNPCYAKTSLHEQPVYLRASPMITPSVSPAISRAGSFRRLDDNNNNAANLLAGSHSIGSPASDDTIGGIGANSKSPFGGAAAGQRSFDALVSEKLLRGRLATPTILINNAPRAPDADDNASSGASSDDSARSDGESDGSDGMQGASSSTCKVLGSAHATKRAVPKAQQQVAGGGGGLGARRRSTLQSSESRVHSSLDKDSPSPSLLVMEDRFTLAPSPLPSCPPSPNLNRHCTECISLRQEARLDAVERDIRRVAEQFLGPVAPPAAGRMGGVTRKLACPLRWLRTLAASTKHSYKFPDESTSSIAAAAAAAQPPIERPSTATATTTENHAPARNRLH